MKLLEWILGRRRTRAADPQRVADMLRTTLTGLDRLPMLPAGAAEAMAAARSADTSLEHLARLIERDPALAANLLRLANSALYGTTRPAQTLYEAVVKVGTRECYNAILAVAMKSLFRNLSPAQRTSLERLWQHALLTACVCRRLDARFALRLRGEEFTCGLTHDIGRVLIALGAPDHAAAADPVDFAEGPDTPAREQAVLGTDHCEMGAWFAGQNGLPPAVVECAQFHHTPAEAGEYRRLVALVAAADHMANFSQREDGAADYDAASNPHWPLLARECGVAESLLAEAAPQVLADAGQDARDMATQAVRAPARAAGPKPASHSGPERRGRGTRYALALKATCHPLGKERQAPWQAIVEDVSLTGLSLRLGCEVGRGTLLAVRTTGLGGRFAHPLLARVRNARQHQPGQWRVGCALVKPLTDDELQAMLGATSPR